MEFQTKYELAALQNPHLIAFRIPKRTVADLMGISLNPSSLIIRPVPNDYQSNWTINDVDWAKAWGMYSSMRAVQGARSKWGGDFKNWFDRIRFNIHVLLIRWKVVI